MKSDYVLAVYTYSLYTDATVLLARYVPDSFNLLRFYNTEISATIIRVIAQSLRET